MGPDQIQECRDWSLFFVSAEGFYMSFTIRIEGAAGSLAPAAVEELKY